MGVPLPVVEIVPVRVVEIVPARLLPRESAEPDLVVEIVPALVVEMVPALVVEMVPVFAVVVVETARTNIAVKAMNLTFVIALAPFYWSGLAYVHSPNLHLYKWFKLGIFKDRAINACLPVVRQTTEMTWFITRSSHKVSYG